MLPEPIAVTLTVTSILENLNIPYFIGGSLASTLHGIIRTTQDSDIVADIQPDQIATLLAELGNEFYIDEEMIAESVSRKSSFNILHRETMFKVDIFVPEMKPFNRSQFMRAQQQAFSRELAEKAFVASAEDTILMKLDWYRMGGGLSERQWRDVVGILKVQGERLDLDYLRQWAQELNVSDLLERALSDSIA
ncbi:MAG: hypothetical protein ACK2TV_07990 [Anaerolineales bacterium]